MGHVVIISLDLHWSCGSRWTWQELIGGLKASCARQLHLFFSFHFRARVTVKPKHKQWQVAVINVNYLIIAFSILCSGMLRQKKNKYLHSTLLRGTNRCISTFSWVVLLSA